MNNEQTQLDELSVLLFLELNIVFLVHSLQSAISYIKHN